MKRHAALTILGAWLMGTVFMALVATQNFYLIDRLLAEGPNASFTAIVEALGQDPAREMLRYVSSELNRLFFAVWGSAQIVLGGALVACLGTSGSPRVRRGAWGMLILALVLAVGLTPPILSVGRALDFVPRDPRPPALATFGLIHAAYSLVDFTKLALGATLLVWIHRLPR